MTDIDSRLDRIESSLDSLNEKLDIMATKNELLEVKAMAQEAQFSHSKHNWLISGLIGALSFIIGIFVSSF